MLWMSNDGRFHRGWVSRVAVLVAVAVMAGAVQSASAGLMNLGTHMGTFSGNDDLSTVAMNLGMPEENLMFVTRFEEESEFESGTWADFNNPADVDHTLTKDGITIESTAWKDGNPDEAIAGTWMSDVQMVFVVTPKAGNGYALYIADGTCGLWDTSELEGKGISHLSFYKITGVIPEPASLALMGLGGLALLRRRRRRA